MSTDNNKNYFSKLLKSSKSPKKQIAVYLDEHTIEKIDMTIKLFSSISDAKSFSRTTFIEEAINKFLQDSEEYLYKEHDINVEQEIEETRSSAFDTVIFSSRGRGFEETFLGEIENEPCWHPCRVSDHRKTNLKYIAIYRGTPVSAITHYAKIKEFKYDEKENKTICYFDGSPIELPNKIELGDKDACFFVGTKYTTLDSLLNATKTDDLIFG